MVISNLRVVRFVVAALTTRDPFIGKIIQAGGILTVERRVDAIRKTGPGTITGFDGKILTGSNTTFKNLL
jgi:hypothetical protein